MDLELLNAAKGGWVPMVNGQILHSLVDPHKEARGFVDRFAKRIQSAHTVIVLGFGGGFHIQEIYNRFKKNIVVIECVREIPPLLFSKSPELREISELVLGVEPQYIMDEASVIDSFQSNFTILIHQPSYRINQSYYDQVLERLTARSSEHFLKCMSSIEGLKGDFLMFPVGESHVLQMEEISRYLSDQSGVDRYETQIWSLLRELVV